MDLAWDRVVDRVTGHGGGERTGASAGVGGDEIGGVGAAAGEGKPKELLLRLAMAIEPRRVTVAPEKFGMVAESPGALPG